MLLLQPGDGVIHTSQLWMEQYTHSMDGESTPYSVSIEVLLFFKVVLMLLVLMHWLLSLLLLPLELPMTLLRSVYPQFSNVVWTMK